MCWRDISARADVQIREDELSVDFDIVVSSNRSDYSLTTHFRPAQAYRASS